MLVSLPAILIALTFHEYAHGRVAYALGDDTAKRMGRLTINPIPHIDVIGFLMLIFAHFGWAKPVPVNPGRFRSDVDWRRGMLFVAIAGPLMNLFIAVVGAFLYKLMLPYYQNEWVALLLPMVQYLIIIDLVLAIFNMLPIPPLDGSKVLASLLPETGSKLIYSLEQYGPILLLLLVISGLTGKIISPAVMWLYNFLVIHIIM